MIRKLTEHDHERLMSFLVADKSFNLFFIGDIENYGYDQDFQEIWGEIDESGELKAVLLRYYHSYLPYAKGEFDHQGFARIINQDAQAEMLSGKREVVQRFEHSLRFSTRRELYFSEMRECIASAPEQELLQIKKATLEDVDDIFSLKEQIEEFKLGKSARESFRQTLRSGSGRTFFLKQDNEVLACASTSAENSFSAMVVGVCTHPTARKKGFATLVLQKLCLELLQEGKTLCLFYDNPAAGGLV